ncbi:MAG: hypothetical protein R6X13_07870 [bacterium]
MLKHGPDPAELRRLERRYLVHFRAPLLIEEGAVRDICHYARVGYETPRKRETYGFLYGQLDADGRITIRRACYYRGAKKTRTSVQFKNWGTIRRVRERRQGLATSLHMRFVGSFHSHVEVAGSVYRGLSPSDRESFRYDVMSAVEIIAFIWPGIKPPQEASRKAIVAYDTRREYHYRIRAYAKRLRGIRHVPLKVCPSGVIIVH